MSFNLKAFGLLCVVFHFLGSPASARAQKTDVVTLKNGDTITGEIKSMTLGRLSLSTDAASTISIEWPEVTGLQSDKLLEMELSSGLRVFGSLEPLDAGRLAIVMADQRLELPLSRIVSITAIKTGFWSRLDGLISFGFDLAKANDSRTLNTDIDVNYRAPAFDITIDMDAYAQSQTDVETTTRSSISLQGTWKFADRWGLVGQLGLEQNAEIDLDLRTTTAIGVNRIFSQTSHIRWQSLVALGANWEQYEAEPRSPASFEGVAGSSLDWFVFGDNETSFNATLVLFPNLSDPGRVRTDFDIRLSRELVLDFFVAFSGFYKSDNGVPTGTGETTRTDDYGFSISVGYDW